MAKELPKVEVSLSYIQELQNENKRLQEVIHMKEEQLISLDKQKLLKKAARLANDMFHCYVKNIFGELKVDEVKATIDGRKLEQLFMVDDWYGDKYEFNIKPSLFIQKDFTKVLLEMEFVSKLSKKQKTANELFNDQNDDRPIL